MRRVALLFGGSSHEHEVSLASAHGVLAHAPSDRYDIDLFGIDRRGDWRTGPGAWFDLLTEADPSLLPRGIRCLARPPGLPPSVRHHRFPPAALLAGADAVLPLTHGALGEDGAIQGLCRLAGVPLVGCDVLSSAVCFDKRVTKQVLERAGLPVVPGFSVDRGAPLDRIARDVERVLGRGPFFVKPVRGGSSLGIARVADLDQLPTGLAEAWRYDDRALVERLVDHVELVVGVIERGGGLVISPPGRCAPVGSLYTYEEKYVLGNQGFRCPAGLPTGLERRARDLAARAFRALGCRGFGRIDLFLRASGALCVNEVNTIPGMTSASVFPRVMAAAGLPYPALLDALVDEALGHAPGQAIAAAGSGPSKGLDLALDRLVPVAPPEVLVVQSRAAGQEQRLHELGVEAAGIGREPRAQRLAP